MQAKFGEINMWKEILKISTKDAISDAERFAPTETGRYEKLKSVLRDFDLDFLLPALNRGITDGNFDGFLQNEIRTAKEQLVEVKEIKANNPQEYDSYAEGIDMDYEFNWMSVGVLEDYLKALQTI
jgi:hypothetical protein|tara:strand:+ start:270 stop:647 length:378 start_codon:yes stop_codon:yes gene_type:complete